LKLAKTLELLKRTTLMKEQPLK